MTFKYYLCNNVGTLTDIWGDKLIYQEGLWRIHAFHTRTTVASYPTQAIINMISSQDLERLKAEYELYRILNEI